MIWKYLSFDYCNPNSKTIFSLHYPLKKLNSISRNQSLKYFFVQTFSLNFLLGLYFLCLISFHQNLYPLEIFSFVWFCYAFLTFFEMMFIFYFTWVDFDFIVYLCLLNYFCLMNCLNYFDKYFKYNLLNFIFKFL